MSINCQLLSMLTQQQKVFILNVGSLLTLKTSGKQLSGEY